MLDMAADAGLVLSDILQGTRRNGRVSASISNRYRVLLNAAPVLELRRGIDTSMSEAAASIPSASSSDISSQGEDILALIHAQRPAEPDLFDLPTEAARLISES